MWRILVAVAAVGALSAATAVEQLSAHRRAVRADRAEAVADAGSAVTVRRVAAIAAEQAGTLQREVRRCPRVPDTAARTACDRMALAHAAAGAKLNAMILRAAAPRVGPTCARLAGRLAGLIASLAYVGVEGTRSSPGQSQVRANARAAAVVAARVTRVARSSACVPGMGGPRV